MSPSLRGLVVTVVLAALAAAAGAWAGASYVLGESNHTSSLHQLVHHELNLTAGQLRHLDILEAAFARKRQALERDIRRANAELATAIKASKDHSPQVAAAVDHSHELMGELQKETISHIFEMRAILTPQQMEKFDAKVFEALTVEER